MIHFVRKQLVTDVRELGSSWFAIAMVRDSPDPFFEKHAISMLSQSEYHRFTGFASPSRARSYLIGRLAAKLALAEADATPSSQWSIESGVYGQPIVGHLNHAGPVLQASISHSSNVAVAVVSPAVWPICVDIEEISQSNVRLISEYLSQDQSNRSIVLNNLELDRQQKMTALWSITEAASKHLGGGLAIDLSVFDIDRIVQKYSHLLWSSFSRLPHIQSWTGLSTDHVLSLVMPKPGNLVDEAVLFESAMDWLSQADSSPANR